MATAVANTAANRRFTFGIRGRRHALRHQAQGLAIFAVGLGVTSGSLWLLHSGTGSPGPFTEMVVLTLANLFVTVMRFVAMRLWVFARPASAGRRRALRSRLETSPGPRAPTLVEPVETTRDRGWFARPPDRGCSPPAGMLPG